MPTACISRIHPSAVQPSPEISCPFNEEHHAQANLLCCSEREGTRCFSHMVSLSQITKVFALLIFFRAECEERTKNYPGAKFKKFSTAAGAEAFVNGESSTAGHKRTATNDADEHNSIVVYSDGACKGNGRAGSIAGIGVYWGQGDPRSVPFYSFLFFIESSYITGISQKGVPEIKLIIVLN